AEQVVAEFVHKAVPAPRPIGHRGGQRQHGPDTERKPPARTQVHDCQFTPPRSAPRNLRDWSRDSRDSSQISGLSSHGAPMIGATMDLFRTKSLDRILAESDGHNALKRSLGPGALVALGIGAVIGAGIFTLTGVVAATNTGPALVISFILTALGCSLAGLCYSEFATMIPVAGSAYTYAYASFGELWAWIIGWDLILEYSVGAATVAIGWSQTLDALLSSLGVQIPASIAASRWQSPMGGLINVPAVLVIVAVSLLLMRGIRESAG